MKKKQFMSKLAALTMAAMMGLSAVPASAVSVLADTKITADDYVDQAASVSTASLNYSDTDVNAAVSAVDGIRSKNFSAVIDATKTDEAISAIGTISASFTKPNLSDDATVDVSEIKMPTTDTDGYIKGTAKWSTPVTKTTTSGGTYYGLTVTVPFTVKLTKNTNPSSWTSLSVVADKDAAGNAVATGSRTEYKNGVSTNAFTDADNLTDLEKTVKAAIESADTSADTTSVAGTKIQEAVQAATHYATTVTVTSLAKADPVTGTVVVAVPQSNGKTRYYSIQFRTDRKTGKEKKLAAATTAVHDALTETKAGQSDYTVDSENTIDKVIAQVLTDKGYSGISLKTYTITTDSVTDYAGDFTLYIPEVKNSDGTVKEAEVDGDQSDFALKKDGTISTLTDDFQKSFTAALQSPAFPMYDDTTADELQNYLNSSDFEVGAASMKSQGIKASNIVVNSVTGTTHGKTGTADITLTLTDRTGKSVRSSYTKVVAKHSDSTKLKEATDTVATVSSKIDTSKYQTKGDTSAIKLGDHKVNAAFAYSVDEAADTTTVEGIAQKVVKDSLNTVINASVTGAGRKLSADYGNVEYTKDAEIDDATTKFVPTIKVTKYKPATSESEGTAEVEVTFRTINDAWTLDTSSGLAKTQTATAKFTLTFGKLKAKASTYIELGGTKYMTLYKNDATYEDNKKISGTALSEHVNSTYSYDASDIADGNDPITWTSSDSSVAIVDASGKITAKGIGTVTITATNANNADVSDSVAVVVKNNDEYKFVDVQDANKFYFSPVYAAADKNVTAGTDATHFSPDAPVTRAQFITWLYKLAGEPAVTVTDKFTDVSADKWYTNAVSWALENGITAGTTSTTFSPDQTLTRGQAMMFLYKAYGKGQTYNRELALQFKDVSETSPFAEAINWGLNKNITNGYTTTQFGIDDPCTRGQAVTFLSGYLK